MNNKRMKVDGDKDLGQLINARFDDVQKEIARLQTEVNKRQQQKVQAYSDAADLEYAISQLREINRFLRSK